VAIDVILLRREHGFGNPVFPRHTFEVYGRGTPFARFSKITGLREEIETVAWRDGRNPLRVRKGIATLGGGTATFEKGVLLRPLSLIQWFNDVRRCATELEAAATPNAEDGGAERRALTPLSVTRAISAILFRGNRAIDGVDTEAADQAIPLVGDSDLQDFYAEIEILIGSRERTESDSGLRTDQSASAVRRLRLLKCFPVAYQMADLDAMASEVAIESLTVSFDGLIPDLAEEV